MNAFQKLRTKSDILLIDGAGINHPRGAGLATHVGVAYKTKTVGWLLKSAKNCRPIVVAPGHRISLESSLGIVKSCFRGHKLPEPARLAHEFANACKKGIGTGHI